MLWTHGAAQAKTARAFVAEWQKKNERKVTTEIVAAPKFWIAEDYHQKYRLRSKKALLNALFDDKPTDEQIRESTITARVNGWISGYGSPWFAFTSMIAVIWKPGESWMRSSAA